MTKKECIALLNRYAEYDGMGIQNLAGCREAMRMAAKLLSQPSLPSNLDEATEKYSNIPYNFGEFVEIEYEFGEPIETIVDDKVYVKDAFRAGAEWMEGQGVTKEAVIGMATEEIYINVSQQILDKLDLCPGDKVVVQIRKK